MSISRPSRSLFLSTPSARRATEADDRAEQEQIISIHALREEGDPGVHIQAQPLVISIHALREEGDLGMEFLRILQDISIHALREEGDESLENSLVSARISIHALREEGDARTRSRWSASSISIHALREEGDRCCRNPETRQKDFYPRPPRGGRPSVCRGPQCSSRFLSTPSARRATACENHRTRPECYFYPRPPRGGRLLNHPHPYALNQFLSTPSARRATEAPSLSQAWMKISIHALREEGDSFGIPPMLLGIHFYPRPPRGGRLLCGHERGQFLMISIHALREEGDSAAPAPSKEEIVFLSTPSARRATCYPAWCPAAPRFLSTPSARRATPCRRKD